MKVKDLIKELMAFDLDFDVEITCYIQTSTGVAGSDNCNHYLNVNAEERCVEFICDGAGEVDES